MDDWNRNYSARFGHELSLGASYIYAWNGFRFLLDGQDLCLDVWQPVSSSAFAEAIRLLESVQEVIKEAEKVRISPSIKSRQTEPWVRPRWSGCKRPVLTTLLWERG